MMNPYYTAFIEMVNQRDQFYLYVFLAVATAVLIYRLFSAARRWLFRLALAGGIIIVLGTVLWGLFIYQNPI